MYLGGLFSAMNEATPLVAMQEKMVMSVLVVLCCILYQARCNVNIFQINSVKCIRSTIV